MKPTGDNWTGMLQGVPVLSVSGARLGSRPLASMRVDQLWFALRYLFNNCVPAEHRINPHRDTGFTSWQRDPAQLKRLVLALVVELTGRDFTAYAPAAEGLEHIATTLRKVWPNCAAHLP